MFQYGETCPHVSISQVHRSSEKDVPGVDLTTQNYSKQSLSDFQTRKELRVHN